MRTLLAAVFLCLCLNQSHAGQYLLKPGERYFTHTQAQTPPAAQNPCLAQLDASA